MQIGVVGVNFMVAHDVTLDGVDLGLAIRWQMVNKWRPLPYRTGQSEMEIHRLSPCDFVTVSIGDFLAPPLGLLNINRIRVAPIAHEVNRLDRLPIGNYFFHDVIRPKILAKYLDRQAGFSVIMEHWYISWNNHRRARERTRFSSGSVRSSSA
ncbi:hypothetical protein [Pseudomonas sp. NFACC13-1]|uniref:hypothetical protein n=1 Tax=Pseudomonas sp. NFACC13-1 TaxID=1566245 RepID=UPI0015A198D3